MKLMLIVYQCIRIFFYLDIISIFIEFKLLFREIDILASFAKLIIVLLSLLCSLYFKSAAYFPQRQKVNFDKYIYLNQQPNDFFPFSLKIKPITVKKTHKTHILSGFLKFQLCSKKQKFPISNFIFNGNTQISMSQQFLNIFIFQ